MKVFKFKCNDCGSRKYEKIDEHTYKCIYCGSKQEIIKDKTDREQEWIDAERQRIIDEQNYGEEYDRYLDLIERQERILKKRTWVGILCYVFGYTGIHRFAQRKMVSGFLFLFTFGLLGFGWIYDIIKYCILMLRANSKLAILKREFVEKFGEDVDEAFVDDSADNLYEGNDEQRY